MTVRELMSKLSEASKGDLDLEVEIHAFTGAREIEAKLEDDAKSGDCIILETRFDEYSDDIFVKESEAGGFRRVCIAADCG